MRQVHIYLFNQKFRFFSKDANNENWSKTPYQLTYLTGIDIARKRAGQVPLSDSKSQMKLDHNELSGVTISVSEQEKLENISSLAKFRPSKSREVAKKILANQPEYSKEYKYQKPELDIINKKGKFFSYFYPNRESLEERYNRERLDGVLAYSTQYSKQNNTFTPSMGSTTNTYQTSLRDEWQLIKMTKELCDRHGQPVTKFSYPFIEFLCHD